METLYQFKDAQKIWVCGTPAMNSVFEECQPQAGLNLEIL